jgi:hypothetical protein
MDKIITKRIVNRKFWLLVLTMSGILFCFLPFIEQTIFAQLIGGACKQEKYFVNLFEMISVNLNSIYYSSKFNFEIFVSIIIELSIPLIIILQIFLTFFQKPKILICFIIYIILILSNMYRFNFETLYFGFYAILFQQVLLFFINLSQLYLNRNSLYRKS